MTVILKLPAIFRLLFRLMIFTMTAMITGDWKEIQNDHHVKSLMRKKFVGQKYGTCASGRWEDLLSWQNICTNYTEIGHCLFVCVFLVYFLTIDTDCRLWNLYYSLMTRSSRITRIFSPTSRRMKIQRIFIYYIYTHASDSSQWRV